ncbi:MAG: 7-cyano-7-deazaguanine synthase QueC [Gammaproteobacteria bacterium]|nr:7-cyano-7-deazaguanine synthase QueC [Gammaproteobacteria bacterium]NND39916.1 7-cyano-7-deazaguanine synthase QueC [Pseudomonadales bacterium]MBT8150822.1 7-cyano-7-deazaguanine synthase QueC [Gammaproteobacteria bacterium]NNL11872.1 7-cyano-7-deazaguanine synthase QueC [Pseudomonadales bacterium]NNM11535.1 7-cyano-7-deazaguanine synthase QueC [Pseudomonadales bacterium]
MAKKYKRAVVLLSGGLDSSTVLAMAQIDGYDCYTLSFNYGQRSAAELAAAVVISQQQRANEHRVINFDLGSIGGSALTDTRLDVPEQPTGGIPITYVPARNTIFLSFALGYAEVLDASAIFVGVNAVDYSGYPDCRPEYIDAFQAMADKATRAGVEGHGPAVVAPLLKMSKAEIIRAGAALGVDYAQTVSCYQASSDGLACGRCDSCRLRRQGFGDAGVADPTRYA